MTGEPDADIEPKPTFDQLTLPDALRTALREVNYVHPTPVQTAALVPALAGKDLVVQARTGTGKTAAFALPLLSGLVEASSGATQALVLTPTRELALQVTAEMDRLARHSGANVCAIYGGAPIGPQVTALKNGAHVVVATPGRVLDHLQRGTIDLSRLRVFVLDECDEMLSMGFLPQINAIWERLPKGSQTLLFSATVPKDVLRIAETRLSAPEFITLSGDHVGALEIAHYVYLSHGDRLFDLLRILDVEDPESAIVFCNTRDETKRVAKELQQAGYSADWLNADLSQSDREKLMARTRASQLRFLVCTDVAARGIDISHLTHVINFDFPETSEQYVHRTGRTGRAGKMGTAISLVGPESLGNLYYLKLEFKIQPVERYLPSRRELLTRRETDVVRLLALQFPQLAASDEYRSLARRLQTHEDGESVVAGLLRAHLGEDAESEATATRKRGRLPSVVERDDGTDSKAATAPAPKPATEAPRSERSPGRRRRGVRSEEREENGIRYHVSDAESGSGEPVQPSGFTNLFVNVGRRDGATQHVLKGALSRAGALEGATGRIAIRERHSYVEVPAGLSERIINELHGTTLCGREAVVEVARPRGSAS